MTEETKIDFYKARNFSFILSDTFLFIRTNFKPLFRSVLFIAGPVLLITSVFYGYAQLNMLENTLVRHLAKTFGIYSIMIITMLINTLIVSTVVNEYIVLYVDRGQGNFTIEDVFHATKRDILKLFGSVILLTIIGVVALCLLIIPAIYLGVSVSIFFAVAIREQNTFSENFGRCFTLTKGKWWFTFGLMIVISSIIGFSSMIFAIPQSILQVVIMLHSASSGSFGNLGIVYMVLSIIGLFAGYLLQTLNSVAFAVYYYSLVEEKEGKSIFSKIEEISNEQNL